MDIYFYFGMTTLLASKVFQHLLSIHFTLLGLPMSRFLGDSHPEFWRSYLYWQHAWGAMYLWIALTWEVVVWAASEILSFRRHPESRCLFSVWSRGHCLWKASAERREFNDAWGLVSWTTDTSSTVVNKNKTSCSYCSLFTRFDSIFSFSGSDIFQ